MPCTEKTRHIRLTVYVIIYVSIQICHISKCKETYFKSKATEEITFALDKVKQYSLAG